MLRTYIDPSTTCTGLATFRQNPSTELWELVHCKHLPEASCLVVLQEVMFSEHRTAEGYHTIKIEKPRYMKAKYKKGVSPQSIIKLSRYAGEIYGAIYVQPGPRKVKWLQTAWKQGLSKPNSVSKLYVVEHRARKVLSEAEQKVLDTALEDCSRGSYRWDIADAVGMGLVDTGRLRAGLV